MKAISEIQLISLMLSLTVTVCLSGCGNTLYFMEGTKGALAVEVSGTSPEPVALTAGYKRTIATLVPPRNSAATKENTVLQGEAVSLLSRFQLEYDDNNEVHLENLFVTGEAARAIGSSVEATNALISRGEFSGDKTQETVSCWIKADTTGVREQQFRKWVASNGPQVSATSVRYNKEYEDLRESAIKDLSMGCVED